MAQQTAVEWLIKNLPEDYILALPYEFVKQAKEMDKEQKKYFFDCGRQYQLTGEGTFTQVYNETYGK
jgi:hypothetical protein